MSPLVDSVLQGYKATVFAYGATGSGKTHTMSGTQGDIGIIPRVISQLFETANSLAQEQDIMFMVQMSYVELYNNNFRDLLARESQFFSSTSVPEDKKPPRIQIHESPNEGAYLTGSDQLRITVTSAAEAIALFKRGTRIRATGCTNLNEHSSRSHAILIFHVESRVNDSVRIGRINLVDLAGSENVSLSGAEGETLTEAQNINLSLSTLGNVLNALSSQNRSSTIIPYRDSKLTYLLKDSLGGNSKTVMITTIRGHPMFHRQTLMSLLYASRGKKIQNTPEPIMVSLGHSKMEKVNLNLIFFGVTYICFV